MARADLGAALILAAGVLAAGTAKAELTVCNDASAPRTLAVAYSQDADWQSEGWWTIDPGACKVVVAGDLTQRHYYYTLSDQPDFAGEGYAFCAQSQSFTLSPADGDCAAGSTQRPFADIDTGMTSASFTLKLRDSMAPVIKADTEAPMIGVVDHAADASKADAATSASFAPGSHGEPFTVNALMQGCGASEELDGCTFYAEGVRWVVSRGAGSNEAALDAMAALPVNAPVLVTGDSLNFGDITVEAMVSKVEPDQPDPYAALRDAMQGEWVSTEDRDARLSVTGSEQQEIYAGEVMAVSVVTFADACPGGEKIGAVFFTQQMGGDPEDLPCYAVVDLTPDRMELSYVGRGNTLSYIRP